MAVDRPVGINDPSGAYTYDAATWRRAQSALLAHGDDLRSASAGVLHGLEVTVADGVTTVGLGSAVVTPAVGANGSYIAVVSAVETVTVPATSSGDRWDRIVLRVQDPEVSGSTRAANILRVAGSEASSPSIPSAPSGTLPLARVRVTTGGASYAVDERVWTAPVGGVIPVADEDLYPSGLAARPGQLVYETYSDRLRVRTATGQWKFTDTVIAGRRSGGSNQAIPNSAITGFDPGPVDFLRGGVESSGTGLRVPVAGIYNVGCAIRWDVAGGGSRQLRLYADGTARAYADHNASGGRDADSISTIVELQANALIDARCYQTSGGDLNIVPGFGAPSLWATFVGD